MSNPKDKADELYSKYDDLLNKDFGNPIVFDNQIKQCALIAVDELIEEACFTDAYIKSVFFTDGYYDKQDYWREVKHEIENL